MMPPVGERLCSQCGLIMHGGPCLMSVTGERSLCPFCGLLAHYGVCSFPTPPRQYEPLNPNIHLGPQPLTEADVRRIVREELQRAKTPRVTDGGAP